MTTACPIFQRVLEKECKYTSHVTFNNQPWPAVSAPTEPVFAGLPGKPAACVCIRNAPPPVSSSARCSVQPDSWCWGPHPDQLLPSPAARPAQATNIKKKV